MTGVTLITPTGDRQEAFGLCQLYFIRQTWRGPVQWIVVDDGEPRTAHPELAMDRTPRMDHALIRPEPFWQPGQNTLARNLLAAIPAVLHELVLILEDDDWYPPNYVERMARALESGAMVGCQYSRYYHLPSNRYRIMEHAGRSSLCHTGFRRELLPLLERACRENSGHIDVALWESVESREKVFFREPLATGVKGLPGRPGIGIGHRPEPDGEWRPDPDRSILRAWIGKDERLYGTEAGL